MQLFKPHNGRLKTLDVAKGMIIIFVVVMHSFELQGSDNAALGIGNDISENGVAIMIPYLCLMLFFIISGYLFKKSRTIEQNLKKNGGKLFLVTAICALVLPLILAGFVVLNGQTPDFSRYIETHIYPLFGSEDMFISYDGGGRDVANQLRVEAGYYFLITMVTAFFFFYAFAYRFLEDERKAVASIIVLITITFLVRQFLPFRPPFYLDIAPIAAAFMMFGAMMAKRNVVERMDESGWKNPKVILCVVASIIAAIAMLSILPSGISFNSAYFGEYKGLSAYPYFIEALLCCFAAMFIFTLLAKIPVFSDLLSLFGRHSLGILLLSPFVTKCIASFFYTLPLESDFPSMSVAATICIIIATFIIDFIIVIYGRKLIGRIVEKKTSKSEA